MFHWSNLIDLIKFKMLNYLDFFLELLELKFVICSLKFWFEFFFVNFIFQRIKFKE